MATLLRFVWCAFLLCRAGVHARRNLCGIAPAWILCCESRSVGAACMRPVGDCLTIPSFDCDGVRSMRRGGIHAARETVRVLTGAGSPWCVSCLVGRGLDPAVGVCLMGTFSGNVAAPGPCVIRFGFIACQIPFLYLRQYGFCPDSWPRFRGRHCGTNALRWFCLRQKTEKPAANSEARGTAKGACGPLWKPRGFMGVARDGFRFSQGKCSLLQYRLFPAGKAHPGSRSETPPAFAGWLTCRMVGAYLANILFPVGL